MTVVGLHLLNMTNCDTDMVHGPTDLWHFVPRISPHETFW